MELDKRLKEIFINNNVKEYQFKKNKILTEQGIVEDKLYYITKGIARLYFFKYDDREYTSEFVFANDFINDYKSFKYGTVAKYNVQTITDVTAYVIKKEDLNNLMLIDSNKDIMVEILENWFIRKIDRELTLLQNTPKQNYFDLLTKSPQYIRDINLKHIASYLGITPQALSRIRKSNS